MAKAKIAAIAIVFASPQRREAEPKGGGDVEAPQDGSAEHVAIFERHVVIAAFETPLLSERICRELVVAADLAREDGRRKSTLPFAAKGETSLPK